jgi:predicted membrane protein DUF2231
MTATRKLHREERGEESIIPRQVTSAKDRLGLQTVALDIAAQGSGHSTAGTIELVPVLLGHPIHQMLIAFPLGLLSMANVFDLVAIATNTSYWAEVAYWMMASGLITALLAAPFGAIDWLAIPNGTRAKTDRRARIPTRLAR